MAKNSDYIRFDWAIKRILRDKANFGVLEGLMTVLIGERITIMEILESESNQNAHDDKFSRVDVKAKTEKGEIILVEVQLGKESFFMPRILFGVSKAITEQLELGQNYEEIKKVYSISVLYFDLGEGDDYAYHGTFTFRGMTQPESELKFSDNEKKEVLPDGKKEKKHVISHGEVFPEFFLLRVNQFNEVAKTPIEEWMDYLKNGIIRDDTTTPGLQEARRKLDYMRMTREERHAYENYMINMHVTRDVLQTARSDARAEGWAEGRAEGRAEGLKEANIQMARKMKADGMPDEVIMKYTGLSQDSLSNL